MLDLSPHACDRGVVGSLWAIQETLTSVLTNYLANTLKLSNYKVNMSFEEVYSILSEDLLQNKVPELNMESWVWLDLSIFFFFFFKLYEFYSSFYVIT